MAGSVQSYRARGTILSVFSSKGGIGATSLTANLGVALAARGMRTVLVDMTFQLGDLGLMFNQSPRAIPAHAWQKGGLDKKALRSAICTHESGVSLLSAVASPETGQEITGGQLAELSSILRTMFDFVVIDLGRLLDDRTIRVLNQSDFVAVMTALDVPAIHNTHKYLQIFDRVGIDPQRIQLVLNRFSETSRLTPSDVERALAKKIFWVIPNDFGPMSLGIDAGTPAITEAPKSTLAQNFRNLAERFHEMFVVPARTKSVAN